MLSIIEISSFISTKIPDMKKIIIYVLLLLFVWQQVYTQDDNSEILETIDSFDHKGYRCINEGKFDSAEFYYRKVLNLKETYFGPEDYSTGKTHINLAVLYRYKYSFEQALHHYDIAESIIKNSRPESKFLSYVYHNKGNIYYGFRDYAEALKYYQYAIDRFEALGFVDDSDFSRATLHYFNSLVQTNKLSKADSLIKIVDKLYFDNKYIVDKHVFLSYAYNELGDTDRAFQELDKAKATVAYSENPNETTISIYNREAAIYLAKNDIPRARESLYKNLSILQKDDNYYISRLILTYLKLANTFYFTGEYNKCYYMLEEAIEDVSTKINYRSGLHTEKRSILIQAELYELFWLQARAAFKEYLDSGDIERLNQSHEKYSETINSLTYSKLIMKNEESVMLSNEYKLNIYHEAILVSNELFDKTEENQFLEQSFKYTESSKSFALLSEIKGMEAMQFSGLPPEILEQEERFTREISAYEEQLYYEQTLSYPDSTRLANFEEILFNLEDDYASLQDHIELNYPKYFELKYRPHFVTIDEVKKKLHRNEALVEYVLADTLLTTFIIDQNHTQILQQTVDSSFSDDCIAYYRMLQSQEFDYNVHDTYREYIRLGRLFYETLVAPVREVTDKKEITFVPDGELMYLPFESFITYEVDDEYIDYMNLPYLIHDLSVAYSYSSTLLFSDRIQTKSPENKVLAFAPMYENLLNDENPLIWNRDANPDFLIPLQGVKEEVSNISRRVPSEVFMDQNATEGNFKKYASDYSILHLAMHTIMNDEEPMFSRLAFTRIENDTVEDNDLFTYEIYNMKLNAEMIVLSSCSSGYGKMQRGEGMMSLSRGFMYAGCPSIVMTLWQVSDRSSADLMSSFYKYLKHGKSKKEALRHAKIDYIKNSDGLKANPYFWSSFVQVGDSTALYRRTASFYWIIIFAAFVGLIFFYQYRGRLKRLLRK